MSYSDSKVHGANMGPIWGRQDPGGSHVGAMNFVIWAYPCCIGILLRCHTSDFLTHRYDVISAMDGLLTCRYEITTV